MSHLQQVSIWYYIFFPRDESVSVQNKYHPTYYPRNARCTKEFAWNAPCILLQVQLASHAQHSQLRQIYIDLSLQLKVSTSSIGVALSERKVLYECDLKLSPKRIPDYFTTARTRCWYMRVIFLYHIIFTEIYTSRMYRSLRHIYSRTNSRG